MAYLPQRLAVSATLKARLATCMVNCVAAASATTISGGKVNGVGALTTIAAAPAEMTELCGATDESIVRARQ
jgi:hypothetical protein